MPGVGRQATDEQLDWKYIAVEFNCSAWQGCGGADADPEDACAETLVGGIKPA